MDALHAVGEVANVDVPCLDGLPQPAQVGVLLLESPGSKGKKNVTILVEGRKRLGLMARQLGEGGRVGDQSKYPLVLYVLLLPGFVCATSAWPPLFDETRYFRFGSSADAEEPLHQARQ